MAKKITFDMNGQSTYEIQQGEHVLIYFVLKYDTWPEYMYLGAAVPAKIRVPKQDNTIGEYNGTFTCGMPGVFWLAFTPAETLELKVGKDQTVEIEAVDAYSQTHIAIKQKCWTVTAKNY